MYCLPRVLVMGHARLASVEPVAVSRLCPPRRSTRQGVLALTEFDPVFGARPLRRLIQTTIEDQLVQKVLAGEVREGDTVTFDADESSDGLIILESQPAVA